MSEVPSYFPDHSLKLSPELSKTLPDLGKKTEEKKWPGLSLKFDWIYHPDSSPIGTIHLSNRVRRPEKSDILPSSDMGIIERYWAKVLWSGLNGKSELSNNWEFNYPPSLYHIMQNDVVDRAMEAEKQIQKWILPGNLPDNLKFSYYGYILNINPKLRGWVDLLDKYPWITQIVPQVARRVRDQQATADLLEKMKNI